MVVPAVPPPHNEVEAVRTIFADWAPATVVVAAVGAGLRWVWKMVRGYVSREEFDKLSNQVEELIKEVKTTQELRFAAHGERIKKLELDMFALRKSIDKTATELKGQGDAVLDAITRLSDKIH